MTKIVCRYDVLLVLEIVDSSGVALKDLLHKVNERWVQVRETVDTAHSGFYKIVTSPRVGKTKSKEQYAIFFRENRFRVSFIKWKTSFKTEKLFLWSEWSKKHFQIRVTTLVRTIALWLAKTSLSHDLQRPIRALFLISLRWHRLLIWFHSEHRRYADERRLHDEWGSPGTCYPRLLGRCLDNVVDSRRTLAEMKSSVRNKLFLLWLLSFSLFRSYLAAVSTLRVLYLILFTVTVVVLNYCP